MPNSPEEDYITLKTKTKKGTKITVKFITQGLTETEVNELIDKKAQIIEEFSVLLDKMEV